jgi:hypothetical protein
LRQGAGTGEPVAADAGEGVCGTIGELAKREGVNRAYVSRVLRLTLLAPEIVEGILEGRQPQGLQLICWRGFRWSGRGHGSHFG